MGICSYSGISTEHNGETPSLVSPELAYLHAIIQAIAYERGRVMFYIIVDDNGAKPCPFEKMLWKGEPSHNPDKGWICDYNGVRITRLGGRKLYGDLIKTHNHAIEYLKSTNNTRADPQTVDVEDLGKAITLFENDIFANSPNQLRTILQAARAYLTLTKRGG